MANIVGNSSDNVLNGTANDDTLRGLAGNDTLTGGAGNDILEGGAGRDTLTGGADADTFRYAALTDSYRIGTSLNTDLILDFNSTQDRTDLSALGFSALGNGYNGTLLATYSSSSDRTYLKSYEPNSNGYSFELGFSNNLLSALNDNNVIFSSGGSSNIAPEVSAPLLDQSTSENTTFSYTFPSNTFSDVDGDSLTYSATLENGSALPSWLTFNAATRTFSGVPGQDAAGDYSIAVTASDGQGGVVSDIFELEVEDAPAGGLVLQGSTGNDTITGTGADERLIGLAGNDTLNGGAGNDILEGGAGRDTLTGGAGVDTFRFTARTDSSRNGSTLNSDIITDFNTAQDRIDLSGLGFTGLGNGNNGTLLVSYSSSSNRTYLKSYQADGSGNTFELGLNGNLMSTLNSSNIIFQASSNQSPTVNTPLADQSATESAAFSYTFASNSFSDADGDSLTYGATLQDGSSLPSWLTFNTATHTFSGTPNSSAAGLYSITVTASDGNGGQVSDTFELEVFPDTGNQAPEVNNPLVDQSATERAAFNYTFASNSFADADGDSLSYSAMLDDGTSLPSWLTFNAATRTFSGTPDSNAAGFYSVVVTASDGQGGQISDTFELTVQNNNLAPVVATLLVDQSAAESSPFSYTFASSSFSDADGDTLTYSATLSGGSSLPSWLSFNSATRTFSGTPNTSASGTYSIVVTANDGLGGQVSDTFTLNVSDTPGGGTTIQGTSAADTLTGTSANEQILGLAGNDKLSGAGGNDTLVGGLGKDNLTGGSGSDTFVYNTLLESYRNYGTANISGQDTITDFTVGVDKIDLSALGITGIGDGYNGTVYVTVTSDGAKTSLKSRETDADGNSFELVLTGNIKDTLSESDFIFAEPTPKDILFLPTLGQSNSRALRMKGVDDDSGITEMVSQLEAYTDFDEVVSLFFDAEGEPIDIAVGGSTVTGVSTASAAELAKSWWYTDTDAPGEALLQAVANLSSQLATLQGQGTVTFAMIWGQGEDDAVTYANAADKEAAIELYKSNTLKVFDYLKAQLGTPDVVFYIMLTGNYHEEGADLRGFTSEEIAEIVDGTEAIRQAQLEMAAERSDIKIAVDYRDLPMRYDVDPLYYYYDVWHLHDDASEIVGQRLADFIADDLGYASTASDNNDPSEISLYPVNKVTGNNSNNQLLGTATADTLDGGLGADQMTGYNGSDVYIVDNAGDVIIENGTGAEDYDTVVSSISWVLGANLENLLLTGNQALSGTGNSLANIIKGNDAANILDGAAGADVLLGGKGSDTYYVDNSADKVMEGSDAGFDRVFSTASSFTLSYNIEELYLMGTGDINGTGNAEDNTIYANSGNNVLNGGAGIDTLSYESASAGITLRMTTSAAQATGGSGSDSIRNFENLTGSDFADTFTGSSGNNILRGRDGNDVLNGGDGNDVLEGGAGMDRLTGGAGADTYLFSSLADLGLNDLADQITGFSSSEGDTIDLSALDANPLTQANDAFSYIGNAAFSSTNATGQLRFDGGVLYGSINSDSSAEFMIKLLGVTALSPNDIVS